MSNYFRGLLTTKLDDAKIVLLGIPYDLGCSCGKGASGAPTRMRELSSYLPPFTMDGVKIEPKIFDYGNFDVCDHFLDKLSEKSLEILKLNKFSLFIGGDHSVSIGLEKSFCQYAKELKKIPVIIHLDAHPDICDFYDNSKFSHACVNMRAIDNGFGCENIVLIGIRGYEEQEVMFLQKHPELKVYNASYLNDHGFTQVLKDLVSKYQNEKYMVYLSYDIDANDPAFAPGTGTPEAFGLQSNQLMKFIKSLFINLPIMAMDLVEISPRLDCNDLTSWLGLKTLYEIFEILKRRG